MSSRSGSLEKSVREVAAFVKGWRRTGAVAPSSPRLVRAFLDETARIRQLKGNEPLRILELGPGTGVITEALTRQLEPGDQLDVVELDEPFYKQVHAMVHGGPVRVFHGDVLEFDSGMRYDLILSSLPFEAIPTPVGTAIWKRLLELAAPDARLVYFKYVSPMPFKNTFERHLVDRHTERFRVVWRNVPPARLYTLALP